MDTRLRSRLAWQHLASHAEIVLLQEMAEAEDRGLIRLAFLGVVSFTRHPHPAYAGVGRTSQATGPATGMARGGQARFPGSSTTSTRRTMAKPHAAAPELAALRDGSSTGGLTAELARDGLQLDAAAAVGADRHERSEERTDYRNGHRSRSLTTQVGDLDNIGENLQQLHPRELRMPPATGSTEEGWGALRVCGKTASLAEFFQLAS